MKKLLITLITILCLAASATALANGYRLHSYSGGHGYGHNYRGKFYAGHYGHNRYRNHNYRPHHYRPNHFRHGGHGHRGHHSDEGAYLLGGLLIGALITDSYHRAQYKRAYPPQRQVIYRTRDVKRTAEIIAPGRHLFRDLDGKCFETHRNGEGDELRSELPAEECDW